MISFGALYIWLYRALMIACSQITYSNGIATPGHISLPHTNGPQLSHPTVYTPPDSAIIIKQKNLRRLELPSDTPINQVIKHLLLNDQENSKAQKTKHAKPRVSTATRTWIIFNYNSSNSTKSVLAHPNLLAAQFIVWQSDNKYRRLTLIGCAGYKVSTSCKSHQSSDTTIFPAVTLEATGGQRNLVLIMLETTQLEDTNLVLLSQSYLDQFLGKNQFLTGIFIGAVCITMLMGIYTAIRRRSVDYLLLLLGVAGLAVWYTLSRRFSPGIDEPTLRRLLLLSPFVFYFLINSIATKRILTPLHVSVDNRIIPAEKLPKQQLIPIQISITLNSGILLLLFAFAFEVIDLSPNTLEWIGPAAATFTPALLLFAAIHARVTSNQSKMINVVIVSQAIGALGSVLYLISSYTSLLDAAIPRALVTYLVPAEALVWAIALSARYHHLDMLVGQRIKTALENEARRVRTELAEAYRHREIAVNALDGSYRLLNQTQGKLISLIDCYTHTMRNLMSRLAIHIERSHKQPYETKYRESVGQLLQSINGEISTVEDAASDALSAKYTTSSPAALLLWKLDQISPAFEQRGIQHTLALDTNLDGVLVDSYPFVETARELLCNVSRYAISHSQVKIDLTRSKGMLILSIENKGQLRADDFALCKGLPVEPADSTFNGEPSHGRGLYTLRRLLEHSGGYLEYRPSPPDQITIIAGLPLRNDQLHTVRTAETSLP